MNFEFKCSLYSFSIFILYNYFSDCWKIIWKEVCIFRSFGSSFLSSGYFGLHDQSSLQFSNEKWILPSRLPSFFLGATYHMHNTLVASCALAPLHCRQGPGFLGLVGVSPGPKERLFQETKGSCEVKGAEAVRKARRRSPWGGSNW